MTVRAKFTVTNIEDHGALKTILMTPVVGNGDPESENSKFWSYTPSGVIRLGTINEAAAAQFKQGGEVYVDFTPIEPPAPPAPTEAPPAAEEAEPTAEEPTGPTL